MGLRGGGSPREGQAPGSIAVDDRSGRPGLLGDGTDNPVGAVFGLGGQGLVRQPCHLFMGDRARPSGSELIVEDRQALFQIGLAPLAHGLRAQIRFRAMD